MPLRSDPSLWFNLPGVVAAYQPVRAPDSLLARHNQAHGGDNRYLVTGTGGTWSGRLGWRFVAAASAVMTLPGIVIDSGPWTAIVAYRNSASSGGAAYGLLGNGGRFEMSGVWYASGAYYRNGNTSYAVVAPSVLASGVMGMTKEGAYRNGVRTALATDGATYANEVVLGRANVSDYGTVDITAVGMYRRTLSVSEIWHASRQMQYCDANPDWSAWGRRRRYYYGPSVAGFQAAWAAHSNAQIGVI